MRYNSALHVRCCCVMYQKSVHYIHWQLQISHTLLLFLCSVLLCYEIVLKCNSSSSPCSWTGAYKLIYMRRIWQKKAEMELLVSALQIQWSLSPLPWTKWCFSNKVFYSNVNFKMYDNAWCMYNINILWTVLKLSLSVCQSCSILRFSSKDIKIENVYLC